MLKRSLFKKISFAIAGTSLLAILVSGLIFMVMEFQVAKRHAHDMVTHIAYSVRDSLYERWEYHPIERLKTDLDVLRHISVIDTLWMKDIKGNLIAYADKMVVCVQDCEWIRLKEYPDVVYTSILSEGVLVGTLGIAIHQEYIDEEVRRVFFWLIAGAVLALGLAFAASTYLTRILLKPLSALISTARRVTEDPDLFTAIENPYQDEFSILINSFNHMLERLQNWQHYLRDWIDSMPTALFGVDREGKIVLANQVAMERFGGNITDKYFFSIYPWLKAYEPLLQNVFQSKQHETVDRLDRVVDYQKQYYRLVIYPLQHYGMGAVIRLDDITQEIQLMDSMIQHEKMMSLGGLAAGMAHELNNPLAGIVQHAQNIERRLSVGLPANQAAAEKYHLDFTNLHCYLEDRSILQFVHGIRELGERASHIIQDMLQFSGKSQPDLNLVHLNDLVARVVKICQHDPKFKHVRVEVQADETLMPIACRAREIEQVIFNCMRNSVEAMLSEPARQKENHILIKISGQAEKALIDIIDNGPGMSESVQKRIFEPFFTTKEVGEGTGLGLSIAYFIVTTKHQGTMSVHSQEGQGTKISITLPL